MGVDLDSARALVVKLVALGDSAPALVSLGRKLADACGEIEYLRGENAELRLKLQEATRLPSAEELSATLDRAFEELQRLDPSFREMILNAITNAAMKRPAWLKGPSS
jgi:hypothetical protein